MSGYIERGKQRRLPICRLVCDVCGGMVVQGTMRWVHVFDSDVQDCRSPLGALVDGKEYPESDNEVYDEW